MAWGWGYRPYVPVARRRAQAMVRMEKLRKKGADIQPVRIEGRKIAHTFWGQAWCQHLEKFSDYSNRLPRGRTYVRNGSVCHLDVQKGKIEAKVSGSHLYNVNITVKALPKDKWSGVRASCAGQVGSMLELLQGKISNQVMSIVTDRDKGLFPLPKEIGLDCSCPDWADMCKHVAAVLYGTGARLDQKPELLFLLRGVDHQDLVSAESEKAVVAKAPAKKNRMLDKSSLSEVFGIDIAEAKPVASTRSPADVKPMRQGSRPATSVASSRRSARKPAVKKRGRRQHR